MTTAERALLLDRIGALEQDHRDLFDRAEKSVMEAMAERDEARGAVRRLLDKNAELERHRDAWIETAAQFHGNEQYYSGLIDSVAPALGPAMYTQDDGGVVPEPLRACLPKAVAALMAERDEARGAVKRLAGALDGMLAGHRECDVTAIESLHDPIVKRIVEGE